MNPSAKARTSSAAGLFQFIEQTWLGTVKAHGAKHGYGQYADLIYRGGDGRWRVEGSARNVVLDLRFDPQAASTMAAELTASNAAYLRGRSGREPGAGDLYAAHFLGPAGAAQLMDAMDRRPGSPAAAIFPEAASANRSIFYRDGRPATVAEVHANLQRSAGDGAPAAASGVRPDGSGPERTRPDAGRPSRSAQAGPEPAGPAAGAGRGRQEGRFRRRLWSRCRGAHLTAESGDGKPPVRDDGPMLTGKSWTRP